MKKISIIFDKNNNIIRKIDASGNVNTLAGNGEVGNLDGESMLFSVGTYRDLITFSNNTPLFKEKIVVVDTFGISRLLSTPI